MSATYVLDTYALVAYLRNEPAGPHVAELLTRAKERELRLLVCLINLGEVVYSTERRGELRAAQDAIALMDDLPLDVAPVDRELTLAAAHIKANHRLSYADAFAVALARQEGATLVTGDPELKALKHLVPLEYLA